MCGIFFAAGPAGIAGFLDRASRVQAHRGPDFQSVSTHVFGDVHVGLGHQRLSVIDLSEAGHQPMRSLSGRMEMIFNGEIYNYRELARQFGLTGLRSTSDSEVALELIERLGIEDASRHFNGMWAIVVLDHHERRLYFSRDRFGKKPMHYTVTGGGFYMASEFKSFFGIEGFDKTPNPVVAARFLAQSLQDVDNQTWLSSVSAFPPASTASLSLDDLGAGLRDMRTFWRADPDSFGRPGDPGAYIERLRATTEDAVRIRLNADVPVGIALSGGIDSSIIASVAGAHSARTDTPFTLFSATNPGKREDESAFIDCMAGYLRTEVHKFSMQEHTDTGLFELLSTCNYHNDGPLPSFAGMLFYKLMEISHRIGVTVVLTGQGADEAFCGYRKYPLFVIKRLVRSGRLIEAARFAAPFMRRGTLLPQIRLNEAKRYLGFTNKGLLGPATAGAFRSEALAAAGDGLSARQLLDVTRYSVPFLCHYEDRMSMAWSREIRSPFLDYRLVELGLEMPRDLKMHDGWTKFALRKAFEDRLPPEITWRKDKQGFINPQDDWLKTDLKPHVLEAMGSPDAPVYTHGLVDRERFAALFEKYCAGDRTIWFRDVFAPFSLNNWLTTIGA